MRMLPVFFVATGMACSLYAEMPAVPRIDPESVKLSQNWDSRLVTVEYTLEDAPGIVTIDFVTNGVSIGQGNLRAVSGEINRLVQPGNYVLKWKPYESWPDHEIPAGGIKAVVTAWSTNSPPDYMVIDISGGPNDFSTPVEDKIRYYTCEAALPFPGGVTNDLCKTDYLVMRKIHAAGKTFRMGITEAEKNGDTVGNAAPHYVQLTNDYYLGVYEFTQKQWNHLAMKEEVEMPKYFTVEWERRPVTHVGGTWVRGYTDDASHKVWPRNGHEVNRERKSGEYTALYQLRQIVGGMPIDLPTEAQWEFAARAGRGGIMPDGSHLFVREDMAKYGRFPGSPDLPEEEVAVSETTLPSEGGTAIVGSYPPNDWGLYDMFGNVMELCLDKWGKTYDPSVTHIDPAGADPVNGNADKSRVLRGGHYGSLWSIASRDKINVNYTDTNNAQYTGFRVCLTLP